MGPSALSPSVLGPGDAWFLSRLTRIAGSDPIPTDQEARTMLLRAFRALPEYPPTPRRLQAIQAIGRFEGRYGAAHGGWNNWGSIQCKQGPPCAAGCVPAAGWCFEKPPTKVEGARRLVAWLLSRNGIREAIDRDGASAWDIAEAMKRTNYFGEPVPDYATAIADNARDIARHLKEPLLIEKGEVRWDPAPALLQLVRDLDARWPDRQKQTDGILPSDEHRQENPTSKHAQGDALDITSDPAIDPASLSVVLTGDPRVSAVIYNRQIWEPGRGWQVYAPSAAVAYDPHVSHIHVSIYHAKRDDASPWNLSTQTLTVSVPGQVSGPDIDPRTLTVSVPGEVSGGGSGVGAGILFAGTAVFVLPYLLQAIKGRA